MSLVSLLGAAGSEKGFEGKPSESDINDLFDELACFETTAQKEGYEEGLKEGREESRSEGLIVGFNTGLQVGFDVFYAKGFCQAILNAFHVEAGAFKSNAVNKLCKDVLVKVKNFPSTNVESEDTVTIVRNIKSQTDKLKSLLGEQPNIAVQQKYTF